MFYVHDMYGLQHAYVAGESTVGVRSESVGATPRSRPVRKDELREQAESRRRHQVASAYERCSEEELHVVLRVGEVMSSPTWSVRAEQTLAEVNAVLKRFAVRHLPVTGGGGSMVGIMSQRDVLGYQARGAQLEEIQVEEAMTREVLTTRPEASLREAARVMLDARVGALPVVDAAGKLVGIVTRSDVLAAVVERAPFSAWG